MKRRLVIATQVAHHRVGRYPHIISLRTDHDGLATRDLNAARGLLLAAVASLPFWLLIALVR